MTLSKPLAGLFRLALVLAVLVFLPATNVLLLSSPAYVALEYGRAEVPPSDRYEPAVRLKLSQGTVRWLNSGQGIDGLAALRNNGEAVYNARELQHMADVKVVMDGLRWAWRGAGVILLLGLALALWRPAWRKPFAGGTFLGGALLVAALAGILVSALLSFDWFFVRFHGVFFSAGTWMFDYEDSLIQFYPVQFWMDTTFILGAVTLVEGLLVGGLSHAYLGLAGRQR